MSKPTTGGVAAGGPFGLAATYALFDYLVAGPFQTVTYNVSNDMTPWLAAVFVSLPQGIAAALLGWFAVRQGIANLRALVATGTLLLAVRVALNWQMTVFAVSDVVMPTLLLESLVVPLAFAAAAGLTRRVDNRLPVRAWRAMPAISLAGILAILALAWMFVVRPLQWLMLLCLGRAPVEVVPLLMGIVPFAVSFAASRLIAGRRWLSSEGCLIAGVFVVACHIAQWVLGGKYADHWLALAFMWMPVLGTAAGFLIGYMRGCRGAFDASALRR
nr:hypothetical protein [Luteibacter rhizovicinus]